MQPTRSRITRRPYRIALLEALEPRQLLTADLTGAFTTVPTLLVTSGTRQTATFTLSNQGDLAAPRSTVQFFVVPQGTAFDPTTTALKPVRTVTAGGVRAGGSLRFNVSIPFGLGLTTGNYQVEAVIDPLNRIPESNESNNVIASGAIAVQQPNFDLAPAFATSNVLVSSVVAGTASRGILRLVITNPSTSADTIPGGTLVGVQIVARPVGATDASTDILLSRSTQLISVGALAPGQSRTVAIPITFPSTLPAGSFDIVAEVNGSATLAEMNPTNNTLTFTHPVLVGPPASDPALAFDSNFTLPASVAAQGQKLPLVLDLTNAGNISTGAAPRGTITVVAEPVGGGTPVNLGTFPNINLSGIGPTGVRRITLAPTIPATLPIGQFNLVATLDNTVATNTTLNDVATTADLPDTVLNVAAPFVDFAPTITRTTFAPALLSDATQTGTVFISVGNLGNALIPAGQRTNLTVALRPVGAIDSSGDVVIGSGNNLLFGNLAAGGARTVAIPATIPASMTAGSFQLVTTLTPVGTLDEASVLNNTFVDTTTLTLAPAFTDVGISEATTTFSGTVSGGAGGIGRAIVQNLGNTLVTGHAVVQFFASTSGNASDGVLIGSTAVSLNLVPNESTTTISLPLTIPTPVSDSTFTLFARVVPSDFTDTVTADDTLEAGTVNVTSRFVALRIASAGNPFGSSALGGSAATTSVVLQNLGTGAAAGTATVTFFLSTSTTIDSTALPIGAIDIPVALPAGQSTAPVSVQLTLPDPATPTTYALLARITGPSGSVLTNSDSGILGTITVFHV